MPHQATLMEQTVHNECAAVRAQLLSWHHRHLDMRAALVYLIDDIKLDKPNARNIIDRLTAILDDDDAR